MVAAIETIGTVIGENRLLLDEGLPVSENSRVRVIVFIEETGNNDIDEAEWLYSAARNESLAFLAGEENDIYTLEDGRPV